jgi:hypothetical protein
MDVRVIDGRFVLDAVAPRVGGTAHVHRATDHADGGARVAVKLYDGEAIDDELRRECFLREHAALQALSHPNIVRLISAGPDRDHAQHYLALEWIELSLLDHLASLPTPEREWNAMARSVLRPLLLALSAAHARHILHRDVKPANLMFGDDGQVKLTDFGVAKLLDSVRFGLTVSDLHSKPYAAPERDSGEIDERSDLYSLGVTMIDLLGPRRLSPSDVPVDAVRHLQLDPDAYHFLSSMVAADPKARPLTAKLAITELDRLLVWSPPPEAVRPRLRVAVTTTVINAGRAALGISNEAAVRRRLIRDLTIEAPSIVRDRRSPSGWDPEHEVALDVVGQELLFSARFDREGTGTLVLRGLRPVPPNLLERRRDDAIELMHELIFEGRIADGRGGADQLIEALSTHELAGREAELARAETQLFDRWSAVLEAKTALEARREQPIAYKSVRREGDLLLFSVGADINESYVGQTRRIPLPGGGAVVGGVAQVGDGEIGLAPERGYVDALPDQGQLLIDRVASRRAIDRQKRALADLREDDAARSDFGELLVHPHRAAPLAPLSLGPFLQDLDEPKRQAVEAALASPDFTLVQGPPGTGKTTFIAELVAQLLNARPDARVLLSSQTHVAVDHAAVKIDSLPGSRRMVRVGRSVLVDTKARHLTVSEQLQQWHREARTRGQAWLDEWGQARGISSEALEAYALAAELANAVQAQRRLETKLVTLGEEEEGLLNRLTDPNRPAPSTASTGEMLNDEEDELAAVQDEAETHRAELTHTCEERERTTTRLKEVLGIDGQVDTAAVELALRTRFPVGASDLEAYRDLLALQDEWLLRFGQGDGFDQALLAQAQVVAGTCIGLAGALDDQDVFDMAIVDEVSKATPTEALVPMIRSRSWVLVGDDRQLPPYLDSGLIDEGLLEGYDLHREDLEETLFSQLATLPEDRRRVLSVQHRMLRPIGKLISRCFYDDGLASSRPDRSELSSLATFPAPVTWYSTAKLRGRREKKVGTTYWNESELRLIRTLVGQLQARAQQADEHLEIAVIAGYGEQARRVRRDLRPHDPKWSHLMIDVHPVDSFQGQERHVVIYSVTRSNASNNLGFLRSERRINVALSRAQDALIIVGDARFCARARDGNNPFATVLEHIKTHEGCVLQEAPR